MAVLRLFALVIAATTALSAVAASAVAQEVAVVGETAPDALLAQVRDEIKEVAGSPSGARTVFEARRLARRAADRAQAYLNSQAYFAAEVGHAVDAGPPVAPRISITPGPRFVLRSVRVDYIAADLETQGAAPLDPSTQAELDAAVTLKPGDLALPAEVIAQEARLVARLRALGYGEARALERRARGDREAGDLELVYRMAPGARLRLGTVEFGVDARTRSTYLARLVPFEPGALYTPDALASFNRRLSATRLYSVSSARLADAPTRLTQDGDEVRDVLVTLTPRARYTLTGGASFSTSEGPGLTGALVQRDPTRRGDTLTTSATLAAQERALRVDWRIPNVFAYNRSVAFLAEVARDETDAFDRESASLVGAYEVERDRRLTYALGAETEFTREIDALGQRDLQILSVSAGARLDHANDLLDPTRGWRADVRVEPAAAIGDATSQFLSLNGQLSAYQPLSTDRLVAAARVRSGFVYGAATTDLPVSRRFFAGGGGSARGFAFQSVGPKDDTGAPIGGRGLLEVSSELRWRGDGALGYVAFLDAASVTADQAPSLDDLRTSAGLGVRYQTVVGPIRFDVAAPLDREDGDDPVQIYVSLGQAF